MNIFTETEFAQFLKEINKSKMVFEVRDEKNIDIFLSQKVENSIVDPPINFLGNMCGFWFCLKSE